MIGAGLDDGDLLVIDRSLESRKWKNSNLPNRWRVHSKKNKKRKKQTILNP